MSSPWQAMQRGLSLHITHIIHTHKTLHTDLTAHTTLCAHLRTHSMPASVLHVHCKARSCMHIRTCTAMTPVCAHFAHQTLRREHTHGHIRLTACACTVHLHNHSLHIHTLVLHLLGITTVTICLLRRAGGRDSDWTKHLFIHTIIMACKRF